MRIIGTILILLLSATTLLAQDPPPPDDIEERPHYEGRTEEYPAAPLLEFRAIRGVGGGSIKSTNQMADTTFDWDDLGFETGWGFSISLGAAQPGQKTLQRLRDGKIVEEDEIIVERSAHLMTWSWDRMVLSGKAVAERSGMINGLAVNAGDRVESTFSIDRVNAMSVQRFSKDLEGRFWYGWGIRVGWARWSLDVDSPAGDTHESEIDLTMGFEADAAWYIEPAEWGFYGVAIYDYGMDTFYAEHNDIDRYRVLEIEIGTFLHYSGTGVIRGGWNGWVVESNFQDVEERNLLEGRISGFFVEMRMAF
jgi:hypothetical protein